MITTTWAQPADVACVPADDIRPLVTDALASISGAIAREKSRVATIGLLRAQSDVKKLLALLPDGMAT